MVLIEIDIANNCIFFLRLGEFSLSVLVYLEKISQVFLPSTKDILFVLLRVPNEVEHSFCRCFVNIHLQE